MALGSMGFIGVVLLVFLVPGILEWLWNITLPQLFGWPMLNYWQAFRIMIIADLLFGGAHFGVQNNSITFGL